MTTIIVPAGQVSAPQAVAPGVVVTATPTAGGTAYVEYTLGSLADIQNGVATWYAWPRGTVSTNAAGMFNKMGFVRCTAGTAAAVLDTNFAPNNQQLSQYSPDWGGSLSFSGGGIGLKPSGVLDASGASASVTGTTAETTLATIAVPANSVIVSGSALRVSFDFFKIGVAGTLTLRLRLGGAVVATVGPLSTAQGGPYQVRIVATGPNGQYSMIAAMDNPQAGYVRTTASVDMTQPQNLTLTGQLTGAADTGQIDNYCVEAINK